MLSLKKNYHAIFICCLATLLWGSHANLLQKAAPVDPSCLQELDQLGIFGKNRDLIEAEQRKNTFQNFVFTYLKKNASEEGFINLKCCLSTILGLLYMNTFGFAELHSSNLWYVIVAIVAMTVWLIDSVLILYLYHYVYTNPVIFSWTNTGLLVVKHGRLGLYRKENIEMVKLISTESPFIFNRKFLRVFFTKRGKYLDLTYGEFVDEDILKKFMYDYFGRPYRPIKQGR